MNRGYTCHMSKEGVFCTGPDGKQITYEEFTAVLDRIAAREQTLRAQPCRDCGFENGNEEHQCV